MVVCSVAVVVTGEAVVLTAGTVIGEVVETGCVVGAAVAEVVSGAVVVSGTVVVPEAVVVTGSFWLILL